MNVEAFVDDCRAALNESLPMLAVKEVIDRTIRSGGLDGLSHKAGIRALWCDPHLTVLHVVIPGGAPKSLPHDHRMWAVIGMCAGREADEFFRRAGETLHASSRRLVETGEALALGPDVIHAVANPQSSEASSALHVYGGDLLHARRSMWTEPDWQEEPYDARRATGTTFEQI